jgi:TonB family protein
MAATPQSEGWEQPSRRRGLRYPVQAPLDVTVLRSGIPDTVPGRSVNLGEGGIAAVLAAEFVPGETVGIEIWLPLVTKPVRTRALIRYHDKLRSGMEFLGLSPEQRAAIRNWAAGEAGAEAELEVPPEPVMKVEGVTKAGGSGGAGPPVRRRPSRTSVWMFLVTAGLILLAALWWRWNRGWRELESGIPRSEEAAVAIQPQAHVPTEVMQRLITHRVDPEYPAAARGKRLQGIIALSVVVGRDGSVLDVRPLNGPSILAQAAMDALRWWRFEPYRIDGQPVVAETTVAVEFKP